MSECCGYHQLTGEETGTQSRSAFHRAHGATGTEIWGCLDCRAQALSNPLLCPSFPSLYHWFSIISLFPL